MSNDKRAKFTCEKITTLFKQSESDKGINVTYYKLSCNKNGECTMSADIYPDMGMKSSSLFYNGVYYQPSNPQWSQVLLSMGNFGSFVLFPTPNRVKNCTYTFNGETVCMKKNGEKRDNHGIVYDSKFEIISIAENLDSAKIKAQLMIDEGDENYESFPFKCKLIITYTLTHDSLIFDYEVYNLSNKPMPYGIGLHPAFLMGENDVSAQIKMPSDSYYETDDNLLPTGNKILTAGKNNYDLNNFCNIRDLDLDTVFCRTGNEDVIKYDKNKTQIVINTTEEFKKGVVFTAYKQMGTVFNQHLFCVEHQSTCTDAINLHEQGHKDTGLIVINPGQSKCGCISYTMQNI